MTLIKLECFLEDQNSDMLQESAEPKKQKVLQADWNGIQKVS
jgi:hypothetical protein